VQPHSGSQANMAVLMTLMQPGDKLWMSLAHGGHLTHVHQSISLENYIRQLDMIK